MANDTKNVKDTKVENEKNQTTIIENEDKNIETTKKDGQKNGQLDRKETTGIEQPEGVKFYSFMEAYTLMLKGKVFRHEEWDKVGYKKVAFVKRGQTKVVVAANPNSENYTPFSPTQKEALVPRWYEVKGE